MADEHDAPMIFLAGPPGSGKTTLGRQACEELGMTFLDLSALAALESQASGDAQMRSLEAAIASRKADVVALPWQLQQDAAARALARRSGVLVLLWSHPLDMQARSGHSEPLFTPAGRIKTRGGFGLRGTGCLEFRRLNRTCDETLMLVNVPYEDAVAALKAHITAIREESALSPAAREGLTGWARHWRKDLGANEQATAIVVNAMARYTLHLRSQGASPRALSAVYSDLEAAAMLVWMYDAPKGRRAKRVLEYFSTPPWPIEFERKFSDAPGPVARYTRTLENFARFLRESALLPEDED